MRFLIIILTSVVFFNTNLAQGIKQNGSVVSTPTETISSGRKGVLNAYFKEVYKTSGEYDSTMVVITLVTTSLKKLAPDLFDSKRNNIEVILIAADGSAPAIGTLVITYASDLEGGTLQGKILFSIAPSNYSALQKPFSHISFTFSKEPLKLEMSNPNFFKEAITSLYSYKLDKSSVNSSALKPSNGSTQTWPTKPGRATLFNLEFGTSYEDMKTTIAKLAEANLFEKTTTGFKFTEVSGAGDKKISFKYTVFPNYKNNKFSKLLINVEVTSSLGNRPIAWQQIRAHFSEWLANDGVPSENFRDQTWTNGNYEILAIKTLKFDRDGSSGDVIVSVEDKSLKSWTDEKKFDKDRFTDMTLNDVLIKLRESHEKAYGTIIPTINLEMTSDAYVFAKDDLLESKLMTTENDVEAYVTTLGNNNEAKYHFLLKPTFKDEQLVKFELFSKLLPGQQFIPIRNLISNYLKTIYGQPLVWSKSGAKFESWFDGDIMISVLSDNGETAIQFMKPLN